MFLSGLVVGSIVGSLQGPGTNPSFSTWRGMACGVFWLGALILMLAMVALEPPFRGEML